MFMSHLTDVTWGTALLQAKSELSSAREKVVKLESQHKEQGDKLVQLHTKHKDLERQLADKVHNDYLIHAVTVHAVT